jgi:selenide,water dikinase
VTSADLTRASLGGLEAGDSLHKPAAAEGAAAAVVRGEEKGTDLSTPLLRWPLLRSSPLPSPYISGVETVPLTSLARAGGCAAKYAAARLDTLLAGLVPAEAEDLIVGLDPADDAAVYRLDDERAIVFTVDFFPPLVDDARTFGAIAATNALNDVFAMGGAPLLALSIAAFPEELPTEMLGDVLAGADERVRAAGAILAGGHTIRDAEPKYGLAVVGMVHPDAVWPKAGARPGDALFLTKPLGTGIVLQAHRDGAASPEAFDAAVDSMVELNRAAADTLRPFAPNAVTDITGFGLLGHVHELASRSGVRAVIESEAIPLLPGALALAESGVRTGGDRRNREFAGAHVESSANAAREALAYDPQTAGGLLVSLPAERGAVLEATFASEGLFFRRIGHVEAGSGVAFP